MPPAKIMRATASEEQTPNERCGKPKKIDQYYKYLDEEEKEEQKDKNVDRYNAAVADLRKGSPGKPFDVIRLRALEGRDQSLDKIA